MKREPKNYKIKKIHPRFFWHKCFMCKNEFRKEDMWQIKSNTRGISYVCTECAKTRKEIETYTKAGDGIPLIVPFIGTQHNEAFLEMVGDVQDTIKSHNKYGGFRTRKQEGWF